MRIQFSFKKDNYKNTINNNVNFGAGLTPRMIQEIQNTDILEISKNLVRKGIPTDFKGNKIVAWCSSKTVDIFEQLNKKYNLQLAFPKGIYVSDFFDLNIENQTAFGFCNLFPTELKKNSVETIPSRTVFFNSFETLRNKMPKVIQNGFDWNNINDISDHNYKMKNSSTNHFLGIFIHELSHVAHEDRLIGIFKGPKTAKILEAINNKENIETYRKIYASRVEKICYYASNTPLEAVACDVSRIIVDSLDKATLLPTRNPFIGTPYEKLSLLQRTNIPDYSDEERPLNEILKNFWNGKFD